MSVLTDILIWLILHADLVVFCLFAVAGLALLPFLGMVTKGLLPAMLAEPIATNLFKVTLAGLGGGHIHQKLTDEYEVQPSTGKEEPESHWNRFAGQPLGISYERATAAFRERVEEINTSDLATDGGLPGSRVKWGIDRGGAETFVDADDPDGLFVRVGEHLADLKDSDGIDHVNVAMDQTMRDEGGEGGMETKWRVIFWLGMGVLGTLAGVGVFFVL